MNTQKLYYTDPLATEFEATITHCTPTEDGRFALILGKTAFFPEGGGQPSDTGFIGQTQVVEVLEEDGIIRHFVAAALEAGESYRCKIDGESRLRRMQNHGGEHIVSGIVKRLYGYNNVGFHMGSDDITIDFDGELDRAQLLHVERLANEAVVADRRITAEFYTGEALAALEYRSKKPLEGEVRIVEIEGFDRCACCAPHLTRTGGIGIIKILDFLRYKGGVRVHLLCGFDALEDYNKRYEITAKISNLLSAKQNETAEAVEKLREEYGKLRGECGELRRRILELVAAGIGRCEGNICIFEDTDQNGLRHLVNLCTEKCTGICAAFAGDDDAGYKYVMGSGTVDLRAAARDINQALRGRGGGSAVMIQGSALASEREIREYFGVAERS